MSEAIAPKMTELNCLYRQKKQGSALIHKLYLFALSGTPQLMLIDLTYFFPAALWKNLCSSHKQALVQENKKA